jgi:hypothetical protein
MNSVTQIPLSGLAQNELFIYGIENSSLFEVRRFNWINRYDYIKWYKKHNF